MQSNHGGKGLRPTFRFDKVRLTALSVAIAGNHTYSHCFVQVKVSAELLLVIPTLTWTDVIVGMA